MSSPLFVLFIFLMLLYAFFNGFNNSGTLVAAPISTRAIRPRLAILLAVIAEFLGPFLFGVAVAATIGRDFLDPAAIDLAVLLATAVAVIIWNAVTWFLGIPSSSSHALIGGLGGAAFAAAGISVFRWDGIVKIFISLLLAPLLGFLVGFIAFKFTLWLAEGASPRINTWFRSLQGVTTFALALSHGTNDGQKAMGLMTLGLVVLGIQSDFTIPTWVTFSAAFALALGVATGGYRIIRTLGAKMYRLRPIHGLDSQASAAAIILGSSVVGAPVATTQVISTSILGTGAAHRFRAVRWGVASQILMAWLITIPLVACMAGLLYLLFTRIQL